MRKLFTLISLLLLVQLSAQQELPYYEIPEPQAEYTSKTIISRSVDGLGFRYHWATKDLRDEDLEYRVTEEARSIRETMEHIRSLVEIVHQTLSAEKTVFPMDWSGLSYDELRTETLQRILAASKAVLNSSNQPENIKIIFSSGDDQLEYPLWNLLNGPLADAIYHTGQITTLRRAAGNPISQNISVLQGKVKEE